MSVIDERIVQMVFNNKQFEEGISQSSQSLDNFAEKLNLQGAVDGISQLADHFSAFGVIGDQVLRRIGDKVAQLTFQVTGMVHSLTLGQIGAGFGKFEELTKNTATLVGQGKNLQEVNEQLERLNWFTDETSYNFTDMVANIAKFTASGKDLDDSVTAMQGIATWSALSGQNAATASRAMYQISQAMGSGFMRKEDYKSIQNASMDTEEFRQTALDTAVALGTLRKNADGTYTSIAKGGKSSTFTIGQFADHLTQELWFTDEVMMEVFQHYGNASDKIQEFQEEFKKTHGYTITAARAMELMGDTLDPLALKAFKAAQEARSFNDVIDATKDAVSTGWMNTFKYLIGDYEEATALYSGLAEVFYDIFAAGAERRNAILEMWHDSGGYVATLDAFRNAWAGITEIMGTAVEAFKTIVPWFDDSEEGMKRSASGLVAFSQGFRKVTRSFRDLFVSNKEEIQKNIDEGLITGTEDDVRKALMASEAAEARIAKLSTIMQGIADIFNIIKEAIGQVLSAFKPLFDELGLHVVPIMDYLLDVLSKAASKITEFKDKLAENQTIFNFVSGFVDKIKELIGGFENLHEASEKRLKPIEAIVNGIKTVFERLKEIFTAATPVIKKLATVVWDLFGALHDGIIDALNNVDYDKAKDLLGAGLLGGFVVGFKKIADSLKGFTDGKNGILGMLLGETGLDFLDSLTEKLKDMHKGINAEDLMKLAKAMLVFVAALAVLTLLDSSKLVTATAAMGGLMVEIYLFLEDLKVASEGVKWNQAAKIVTLVTGLGVGLLIMSAAVAKMGSIDFDKMTQGLIGVFGMMATVSLFTKWTSGKDTSKIGGLVAFATSLYVLAIAVEKFGTMDPNALKQGGIAVAVLGTFMTAFSAVMGKLGGMKLTSGLGLIAMAAALEILTDVTKKLGELEMPVLQNGVMAVGLLLAIVAGFTAVLNATGGVFGAKNVGAATGMLIMSAAIVVLAKALQSMAKMTKNEVIKGLIALGGALTEIAIAANLMRGTIGASASFAVFATGLLILAGAFKVLAGIDIWDMIKALGAIAVALGVFVAAAVLLGPIAGTLLAVAGAMALFSVSVVVLAAGVTALSAAIAALGQGLSVGISGIISGLEGLIVGTLTVIGNSAGKFVEVGLTLLLALLEGLANNIGPIIENVAKIIVTMCNELGEHVPEIIQAGIDLGIELINGFANGIRDNTDLILTALGGLLEAVLELIITGLEGIVSTIPIYGDDMVQALEDSKQDLREAFGVAGAEMAQTQVDEYGRVIDENGNFIYEKGAEVSTTAAGGAHGGGGGSWTEAGNANVGEYTGSLESEENKNASTAAGKAVADAGASGAASANGSFYKEGENAGEGYAAGIRSKWQAAMEAAQLLASGAAGALAAAQKSHSPSKVTERLGVFFDQGFINGIRKLIPKAADTASELGSNAIDGMKDAIAVASELVDEESDMNPVITPVLDLSQIQNGVDSLNGMLPSGSRLAFGYSGAAGSLGYVSPYSAAASQNPLTISTSVDLHVTTPTELDERFINKFGKELADKVNVELGKRVW